MGRFDDIINCEYVKSKTRRHMSIAERAAQFGAFRAVTGHEDTLKETARLTDEKVELDEYTKAELNEKLWYINENHNHIGEVTVTYFIQDLTKSGGEYFSKTGTVKKIKEYERIIIFEDGTKVPIDDIAEIDI